MIFAQFMSLLLSLTRTHRGNVFSIGQFLIELPMVNPHSLIHELCSSSDENNSVEQEDTWNWWNTFRTTADFSSKLSIALELSADIPSKLEVSRWKGE